MIKLILVRHGTTICNEGGAFSGLTDSKLSEEGNEQANKLTQYLKDENIIFSGDVLFKGSIGRFDFPNSSKYETIESINKIKEYDFDAVIYPGHGPNSTLSEERLNNPYLKKS